VNQTLLRESMAQDGPWDPGLTQSYMGIIKRLINEYRAAKIERDYLRNIINSHICFEHMKDGM